MFDWFEWLDWLDTLDLFFTGGDRDDGLWYEGPSIVGKIMRFLCGTRLLLVLAVFFPLIARIVIALRPDEALWLTILNTVFSLNTILGPIAMLIILLVFMVVFQLFETFARHIASLIVYGTADEGLDDEGFIAEFVDNRMGHLMKFDDKTDF